MIITDAISYIFILPPNDRNYRPLEYNVIYFENKKKLASFL